MSGRPPIGKQAMTAAERQRRRRKKLSAEKSVAAKKAIRAAHRAKAAKRYLPTPPGVTYWDRITVLLPDGTTKEILSPFTKPLAACQWNLDSDDIFALLAELVQLARMRDLDVESFVTKECHKKLSRMTGGLMVSGKPPGPKEQRDNQHVVDILTGQA